MKFYVQENFGIDTWFVIDSKSGLVWCECPTKDFAEKICKVLNNSD